VLRCVAVCCSVLLIKRVVPHTPTHQFVASHFWMYRVTQSVAVCCSVLQCVAVCCSVLQCVAVCCSVLQCVAMCCVVLQYVAICCTVLHCVAVCCSVLQCAPHTYVSHLWMRRHVCMGLVTRMNQSCVTMMYDPTWRLDAYGPFPRRCDSNWSSEWKSKSSMVITSLFSKGSLEKRRELWLWSYVSSRCIPLYNKKAPIFLWVGICIYICTWALCKQKAFIFLWVCTCMYKCTRSYVLEIYIYILTHKHTHTPKNKYLTHTRTRTRTHTSTRTSTLTHTHTHAHAYIRMLTHIHTLSHTHKTHLPAGKSAERCSKKSCKCLG